MALVNSAFQTFGAKCRCHRRDLPSARGTRRVIVLLARQNDFPRAVAGEFVRASAFAPHQPRQAGGAASLATDAPPPIMNQPGSVAIAFAAHRTARTRGRAGDTNRTSGINRPTRGIRNRRPPDGHSVLFQIPKSIRQRRTGRHALVGHCKSLCRVSKGIPQGREKSPPVRRNRARGATAFRQNNLRREFPQDRLADIPGLENRGGRGESAVIATARSQRDCPNPSVRQPGPHLPRKRCDARQCGIGVRFRIGGARHNRIPGILPPAPIEDDLDDRPPIESFQSPSAGGATRHAQAARIAGRGQAGKSSVPFDGLLGTGRFAGFAAGSI